MCLQKILFSVSMFAIIFSLPLIFTWLLAFLTFSPPLWNFHVFFSNEIVSLGLSLCYPRERKHQK